MLRYFSARGRMWYCQGTRLADTEEEVWRDSGLTMPDQKTIDELIEAVDRAAANIMLLNCKRGDREAANVTLLNYKRGNCSRYVARRQLVLVFNVPLSDVEALLDEADGTPLVVMERRCAE